MRLLVVLSVLAGTFCPLYSQPPLQSRTPAAPTPTTAATPQLTAEKQARKTVAYVEMTCRRGGILMSAKGTGFWVTYPDERLGPDTSFIYSSRIVTSPSAGMSRTTLWRSSR